MNINRMLLVCIGIIALGITIYAISFSRLEITTNTETWGYFSTYMSLFVSSANLTVFIWLSVLVFKYNERRENENDEFKRGIERPVVVLKSKEIGGKETWFAYNIGNGAALNLRIAESRTSAIRWETPVKCYSLGKGDKRKLSWLKHASAICITYEDVFRKKFATIAAGDESQVTALEGDFKQIEIPTKIFTLEDFHAFNQTSAIRIYEAIAQTNNSSSTTNQSTHSSHLNSGLVE